MESKDCDQKSAASMSESELTKPLFINGRFKNPWSTWRDMKLLKALRHVFGSDERNIPTDQEVSIEGIVLLVTILILFHNVGGVSELEISNEKSNDSMGDVRLQSFLLFKTNGY